MGYYVLGLFGQNRYFEHFEQPKKECLKKKPCFVCKQLDDELITNSQLTVFDNSLYDDQAKLHAS